MISPVGADERRSFSIRLILLKGFVIAVFVALTVAFWWFQVRRHQEFAEQADANHIRTIPLRAPRGVLVDRNGQVMVENKQIYRISLMREETQDVKSTIAALAEIARVDAAELHAIVERKKKEPTFRPIPLIDNASRAQVSRVLARQIELPGITIERVPTRRYPDNAVAAHLFGYVNEVTELQLSRPEFSSLAPGDMVGQTGVELGYNKLLMGIDGARYVKVDSKGREIDELPRQSPIDGNPVMLTIDFDMQKALEEAMRHYNYWGAAAFIDPANGDVLAMTSVPSYDPNDFAVGIEPAKWKELNSDKIKKPLINRLLQGTYPPGSTFKILMAVVGLQEGLINPQTRVHCSGGGTFYGRYFQCHKKGGHGSVELRRAIEQSCNVYFYTIGAKLGNKIDVIHKWAEKFGLVGRTGIKLPNESASFVASSEWSQRVRKQPWYPGETVSVSIGQGAVNVTPIGMAMFATAIANGGTLFEPNLVKAIHDGTAWKEVPRPAPRSKVDMNPEYVKAIHEGMWMVVNAAGTGGRARMEGYNVAGKTGTAQANISLENRKKLSPELRMQYRDHGWWIFYAPAGKPEVAGVVFTEGSEHGYLSAPVAKHVLETYFAKKEKRPLPTLAPLPGAPTVPAVPAVPAATTATTAGARPAARSQAVGGAR